MQGHIAPSRNRYWAVISHCHLFLPPPIMYLFLTSSSGILYSVFWSRSLCSANSSQIQGTVISFFIVCLLNSFNPIYVALIFLNVWPATFQGLSLREDSLLFPNSYQLSLAPWLGVTLTVHLRLHAGIWCAFACWSLVHVVLCSSHFWLFLLIRNCYNSFYTQPWVVSHHCRES